MSSVNIITYRALDIKEYLMKIRDNFCKVCIETYGMLWPSFEPSRQDSSDEVS